MKTAPVRRVEIPKDNGGTRNLGIPVVMDSVIQQAITQVFTPVFDPHFSEHSFGFRPHRSAHQAVNADQRVMASISRFLEMDELFRRRDEVQRRS